VQAIKKICLTKEKENYFLFIHFDKEVSFTPRIHLLSNGIKLLLSFDREVALPKTKKIPHGIIKGYFFERFSPSSLMFIAALKEDVVFTSKKYTRNFIKIGFKINKKRTIIVDAGHGGKDSGTKSITGNYEKNITLVTAIELRNALIKSGRYNVVLTRDRDVFVPMEEKKEKINSSKGDLLISLHTDNNNNRNLKGLSVYTLPNLDYTKNTYCNSPSNTSAYYKTLSKSRKFAEHLIRYIPNTCKIKNHPCRNSELKILKTNIPAVLIELGYVSNKIDDELLHSKDFRIKTINAIQYALDSFFEKDDK
jgi:N-acetylmuramoyl-L-alanine amidase